MTTRFWPAIVMMALLQSGCVARTQSQPAVEARLLDSSGNPVSGAEITLKSNGPDARTVSDSNGVFTFSGEHEWSFFLPIGPIDKVNISRLLITAQGQHYDELLSYRLSGPFGGGPAEMSVVCTLPKTQEAPKPETGETGVCQRVPLNNAAASVK